LLETHPNETSIAKSARILIPKLINRRHEAMLEFGGNITVKFIFDRGVSHELVRHRIASFAQESTRYCNYAADKFENEINVISIQNGLALDKATNKLPLSQITKILDEWLAAVDDAEQHYLNLIELGASPQMARSVLPNSTKTEIIMTANYREWRNFFRLRTAESAHPQMLEVTIPLLEELKCKLPVIFGDIE